jgi:hypothetical protein
MADCVNPSVDAPQSISLEGARNMALRKAQLPQLPERDDTVLSFRQLSQLMM